MPALGLLERALARDPEGLAAVRDVVDEVFVGQATEPETLAGLCDDAFAVFSSLGIRHFHRRPTIWDVDERANVNVVDVADAAGVERFVFTSLFHGDELRDQLPVAEARERVVDRLHSTAMKVTVLRPSGFFNDMSEMFEMARRGRVWVVGDGKTPLNPIHGADIAAEVVAALDTASPPESVPLGGPDVLSMEAIAELAFEVLGKPGKVSHLPPALLRGMATIAKPFNENAATFLRMFALVDGDLSLAPPHGTHHLVDHFRALA